MQYLIWVYTVFSDHSVPILRVNTVCYYCVNVTVLLLIFNSFRIFLAFYTSSAYF